MTTLTAAQIGAYASQAGFKGDALVWAIAIALAESSGRTDARHVNNGGSVDRGLWQINNRAHPEVSDAEAYNPASAAKAAYAISSGGKNWHPWATYPTAARRQLPAAQSAASLAGAGAVTVPASAEQALNVPGLGDIGALAKSVAALASIWINGAKWIANPHNWVRVMEVVGGGVAIVIGLHMLGQSGAGGPVVSATRGIEQGTRKTVKKARDTAKQVATAVATDGASAAAGAGKAAASSAGKSAAKSAGKKALATKVATGKANE